MAAPKGRGVAYQSDESGQPEVYAVPFAGGTKLQISAGGGSAPQWQPDGRRIYYLSPDWKVMAADVTLGGPARVGRPQALFSLPPGSEYRLAPDGRILANVPLISAEEDRIHVVVNWTAELKK